MANRNDMTFGPVTHLVGASRTQSSVKYLTCVEVESTADYFGANETSVTPEQWLKLLIGLDSGSKPALRLHILETVAAGTEFHNATTLPPDFMTWAKLVTGKTSDGLPCLRINCDMI